MGAETRRAAAATRHKKSSPSILSHEFFIQNHGDIFSCVLMVFIIGLMFPLTSNLSSMFVLPQYNETVQFSTEHGPVDLNVYSTGTKDIATIFFYTAAWIVGHAVIQEYILDKLQRKVHLSKVKTFKFTESGHQVIFALYSAIHAAYVILEFVQHHTDLRRIWQGYPDEHKYMSLNMKLFALIQISYWIHQFPEFYLQKYKKEEMKTRAFQCVIYIVLLSAAYFMHFMRFATVLLFLEYASQTVFHTARLAHFLEKKQFAATTFRAWNAIFVIIRLASTVLTFTTFWYGLKQTEAVAIDINAGNYNTSLVRLNGILGLLALQLLQVWNFMYFHVQKYKERSVKGKKEKKPTTVPASKAKKSDDSESEDSSTSKPSKADRKKRI